MDNRIIYTNPIEGNVCIVTPHPEQSIDEIATNAVPTGVSYKIVDASMLPTDRTFRNAWKLEDDRITEDWDKCVEITKERLRTERQPLLEAADVQALRDIEVLGAVSSDTLALKQRLRDVTKLADSAKTRDELTRLSVR